MGSLNGFLKLKRQCAQYRSIDERVRDYKDVAILRSEECSQEQASRCMDCGTPFCHWGCHLGNYIPEWNDLLFNNQWRKAYELLSATNNFPEVTGRVCPAPCEYSCVLAINDDAVTIRENELAIIEHAFKKHWVKPNPPKERTGKKIAIVGSGPAALACGAELNKIGHSVKVFEKDDKIGGLLRYGIPNFKLEKHILDRRIDILKKEGIVFKAGVNISGGDIAKLKKEFDAVCLACGTQTPRDLKIEGRELRGIYFAMEYLTQRPPINAKGKKVVVIGGGDTGSDCVGTAHRQGARYVEQIELLPKPSEGRTKDFPWPVYPILLKTSSSHEEGCNRRWSILTKKFIGEKGRLKKLLCIRVEFFKEEGKTRSIMKEVKSSEFEIKADLAILAMGFLKPEVTVDRNFMTSTKGIFCTGDMHRGPSLVVHAINEGRQAAQAIDGYLSS